MRLNRGQKTIRNLLLCALLGALTYAMMGFPPYTVRGILDRAERRYLLSDLEPVLVERTSIRYDNEFFAWHATYVLARAGDTYLCTNSSRHGLAVWAEYRRSAKMSRGAICMGLDGTLYVAGNLPPDAASASAEVTARRTNLTYYPDTGEYTLASGEEKTFAFQGEKINGEVFSFRYREGKGDAWGSYTGLEAAANGWYSGYVKGDEGRSILHADLPVKVTLYDEAGGVLDTLELSVDNYELYGDGTRW